MPAVKILRQVWTEQYVEHNGRLRWRTAEEMPAPAELIASPYDAEVRYSTKRSMEWVGYKVHLTETCDPETPHLIVNVETTPASTPDDPMVAVVHASLAKRDRLPTEHWVDKGYTDAQVLLDSQRNYQVTITGPVAEDPSWQARAGTGFDKAHFAVDWDGQVVTCPSGKQSISWLRNPYPKNGVMWEARFARQDCTPCPFRAQCTHAKVEPRIIGLQTQEQHEVLQTARKRQTTEPFREAVRGAGRYRKRPWTSDPAVWVTPFALYRHGQNPFTASHHGRRREPGPTRRLVEWHSPSAYPLFAVCRPQTIYPGRLSALRIRQQCHGSTPKRL